MIRLLTVPQTGTRWMERTLNAYGQPFVNEHIRPGMKEARVTDPSLPTLVTVRDPMLHAISRLNQLGDEPQLDRFPMWAEVLEEGAHGFRIDVPEEERDTQLYFLEVFMYSHGHDYNDITVDWTPEQPTPDRTGWKARYLAGELAPELQPYADMLNDMPTVLEMLDTFEYEGLIWRR